MSERDIPGRVSHERDVAAQALRGAGHPPNNGYPPHAQPRIQASKSIPTLNGNPEHQFLEPAPPKPGHQFAPSSSQLAYSRTSSTSSIPKSVSEATNLQQQQHLHQQQQQLQDQIQQQQQLQQQLQNVQQQSSMHNSQRVVPGGEGGQWSGGYPPTFPGAGGHPSTSSLGFNQNSVNNSRPPSQLSMQSVPNHLRLTNSQATIQEERHYQNISLYQNQNVAQNGHAYSPQRPSPNSAAPQRVPHNSYSGLPQHLSNDNPNNHLAGIQQMPLMRGRPTSALISPHDQLGGVGGGGGTGYPGSLQDMRRVPPMSHYPGQHSAHLGPEFAAHAMHANGGMLPPFGQRQMPYDPQPRYGLVPRPTQWSTLQPNHARMNSVSASAIGAHRYPSHMHQMNGNGPQPAPKPHQPQPAVSYRYGPSGYPPKNDMPKQPQQQQAQLPRAATLPPQNPASVMRSQIEDQEERLRRLRLEDNKKRYELQVAQELEEQILQAAESRRRVMEGDIAYEDEAPGSTPSTIGVANLDLLTHTNGGMTLESKDVPPPLPKSPPPLNSGPKKVSWSDAPVMTTERDESPSPPQQQQSSSFTLQDIDEVLGTSGEHETGASLAMANTPNVIGAQEVYRDPRDRIKLEKMKNAPSKVIPVPEKLSFKEKMKFFAMEVADQQDGTQNKLKTSKSADDVPVCFE